MKLKDYFIVEILENELMGEKFSKYIAAFDYFNKCLIVLSASGGCFSIASIATVIRAPVAIAITSFI